MRARRERRIAHSALSTLTHTLLIVQTPLSASAADLLRVAIDMTKPRPWWRFW